jgi:hypothetical protein
MSEPTDTKIEWDQVLNKLSLKLNCTDFAEVGQGEETSLNINKQIYKKLNSDANDSLRNSDSDVDELDSEIEEEEYDQDVRKNKLIYSSSIYKPKFGISTRKPKKVNTKKLLAASPLETVAAPQLTDAQELVNKINFDTILEKLPVSSEFRVAPTRQNIFKRPATESLLYELTNTATRETIKQKQLQ